MGFVAALHFIQPLILCRSGRIVVQSLIELGQRQSCIRILRVKLHDPFKPFRGLPAVPLFKGKLRFQKQRLKGSFIEFQRPVKKLVCPVPVSAHHIYRGCFQTELGQLFLFHPVAHLQKLLQIAGRFRILFLRYGKVGKNAVSVGVAQGLRFFAVFGAAHADRRGHGQGEEQRCRKHHGQHSQRSGPAAFFCFVFRHAGPASLDTLFQ